MNDPKKPESKTEAAIPVPGQHLPFVRAELPVPVRDFFAACALQGLLASHAGNRGLPEAVLAAKYAFEYADAMLAEAVKEAKPA